MSDYNFKVKCVDVNVNLGTYAEGGIYEVKNGALSTNKGGNFKGTNQRLGFRNIDELNNWSSSKFEEVKEEGEDNKMEKYDLKKDKIAVLCDTDKKLTELYKLFNSKPNTSVALVCNPSKLYVSWDSESNELTWDSVEYHEINHYTLLTFEEFMNGFVAKTPTTFTITTSDTTTTLTDGTHTTSINRYYTDKHDDMVALKEVVKKYKSEIDEINKDKEIKEAIDKFIKDNNYDVEVEVKRKVVK